MPYLHLKISVSLYFKLIDLGTLLNKCMAVLWSV